MFVVSSLVVVVFIVSNLLVFVILVVTSCHLDIIILSLNLLVGLSLFVFVQDIILSYYDIFSVKFSESDQHLINNHLDIHSQTLHILFWLRNINP